MHCRLELLDLLLDDVSVSTEPVLLWHHQPVRCLSGHAEPGRQRTDKPGELAVPSLIAETVDSIAPFPLIPLCLLIAGTVVGKAVRLKSHGRRVRVRPEEAGPHLIRKR
jgi:hypothetical protein